MKIKLSKHATATLFAVLVLFGSSANAQTEKNGPMVKLTPSLSALHEQHTAHLAQRSAVPFSSDDPLVTLVDDRVVVDAVAAGDVDALKSELISLGMQEAIAYGRVVSGQLPISSVPQAASLASLRFARSAASMTNAGSVTSQGDRAIRSNVARTAFGVDGSGITVGVLSNSFNCLGGAAADLANGDLSPVNVIHETSTCAGAADEGRAMLQIIHDVAPGADLSFATADGGQAAFAANIHALATAGAKIIADDTIYFAEPFFQDGIIAQAVDSVVAGGAAYFSAAGNQARQSYQSAFRAGNLFADGALASAPGAPHFFGGTAHNFNSSGGNDPFQSITIPGLSVVIFILQWDAPFFSVSGSPGTQNDLDLYLVDSSGTVVLLGSAFNNIGGDAVEILGLRNNGTASATVNLMIVKHSGANPGLIKYVRFGSTAINEFDTQSGTIYGHANAAGAEAVGAARYSSTPEFGISPPILESFSSSGATPILFNTAGSRLSSPDPRTDKPEIVAPDGVDTTFFGSDTDGNGFPNFFGISAAAPHAAAVAALLLQSQPGLTPDQIYTDMENTAIDMSTSGFDNDTGFGLIQADAALAAAQTGAHILTVASSNPNSGVSITVSPNDNIGHGNGATQFIRTYNNTPVTLTAPSTTGGNNFSSWSGCDSASGTICNVTMSADKTVTATYITPVRTLTVASSNPDSGVSVAVSPNDNNAHGNGATQFTRLYNNNTPVTLTAPSTAGGNNFAGWSGCNSSSGTICDVTMNADKTVTAAFVAPFALGALTLPAAEVGIAYSVPLATGGLAPYTFTLTKGVFPPGLNFNSANGQLTGMPAAGKSKGFTLQVGDQLGSSVAGTFKITILGALSVSTKSLKAGTHAKAYKGALKATGGKTPYTWSLFSGSLPTGLNLNSSTGAITGTPTQTGTFNPTFRVTDPAGGSAQKALALTIN